jgi:hypothetical protein
MLIESEPGAGEGKVRGGDHPRKKVASRRAIRSPDAGVKAPFGPFYAGGSPNFQDTAASMRPVAVRNLAAHPATFSECAR